MITIRWIQKTEKITIQNESFAVFGRMIPRFDGREWSYTEEYFELNRMKEICFPQENYDPATDDRMFLGAFDGDECVGLAVLSKYMFRYVYLDDLKVNAAYRRQGIGSQMIAQALEYARGRGYRGIYTVGQDNNLAACRFYLKNGFKIGGFDNRVYDGTSLEGDADILFYLDGSASN